MSYQNILVEQIAAGVACVTVNRPKAMNALNHATLGELAAAFDALEADPAVRALVITGAIVEGKPPEKQAFVAGADIGELKAMETALDAKRLAFFGQTVFERLEWMSKPSVAMINGFALGGGCELALACTLRTAARSAKLGLPEVSLGIIPGYGGTQRLARIAGPGVAREWVLTGEMFSADEAHRAGVVNRVFEAAELRDGTLRLVQTILSRAPLAVRLAMETIRRGQNMSQQEGAQIEVDMFGLASTTADMKEGMAAFLEKRPAKFVGR
ncbi:MAG: enoyl-CoA hydratase/isomerase family protein [Planctomycetes bacterium]|nr:enoyl-CoA hydratase/isomerase family protein [Planctomycetota bacterium]